MTVSDIQQIQQMEEIDPNEAYFIKLGASGEMEQECLNNGIIRLWYAEFPFEKYKAGKWDEAWEFWYDGDKGAATRHVNQIRNFFEADDNTLWITFANGCLYWCLSQEGPQEHSEGGSYLKTLDGWHNTDIAGNVLTLDKLSGALLKTRMFQGTICSVGAFDYLKRKINNQQMPEIARAEDAQKELREALVPLMCMLSEEDFELFVDLLFSRSGWQRVGEIGKTQKTVDMEYLMPLTGERAFVQVKCSTTQREFDSYADELEKHQKADAHTRMFYAYHSGSLEVDQETYPDIFILDAERLSTLCIDTGVTEWLINKAQPLS